MPDPASPADPALLARISDLDFIARRVVDGAITGLHRSPFHGYNAEFHQYRRYQAGDDLKYVDWKLFARTDRLYAKQFRETTNLPATLVVDASGSMGFAGRGPLTKLRYAAILAAAFTHLLIRQGDQVGLQIDGGAPATLGARGGRTHERALQIALAIARAGAPWSAAAAIRRAAQRQTRRGLLLVFSDFYDDDTAVLAALRDAVTMGHEVAAFHVLTPEEARFDYADPLTFVDAETGETRDVDTAAFVQTYRARMGDFLDAIRHGAQGAGVDYTAVLTSEPCDDVLRRFLVRQPDARSAQ